MNKVSVGVLATFVVILIGSGLLAYVYRDQAPVRPAEATAEGTAPTEQHNPLLRKLFGGASTGLGLSTVHN